MGSLKVRNVSKTTDGQVYQLKDVSLTVEHGHMLVLCGPKYSGKSALVKIIAGLETASSGEIYIDDVKVNDLDPKDRGVSMLFTNYALYPDNNVYENLSVGLKMAGLFDDLIEKRIAKIAKILSIEDILDKMPDELDEVETHKVAMGRALVKEPKIFLMDEPMHQLSDEQRTRMRAFVVKIQKELDLTIVYVAANAKAAFEMNSEIAIMMGGKIEQKESGTEIFSSPTNNFVQDYIGK